jgi:hypothetical protein
VDRRSGSVAARMRRPLSLTPALERSICVRLDLGGGVADRRRWVRCVVVVMSRFPSADYVIADEGWSPVVTRDYARLSCVRRTEVAYSAWRPWRTSWPPSLIFDDEAGYAGASSTTRPCKDHAGPVGSAARSSPAMQRSSEGAQITPAPRLCNRRGTTPRTALSCRTRSVSISWGVASTMFETGWRPRRRSIGRCAPGTRRRRRRRLP